MFISVDLARRTGAAAAAFAREERGSATVWCLLWLLLFVGMAGLAIDSTNGFRNKTMLQSTADVAALAGAQDVPNPQRQVAFEDANYDAVKSSAITFAHKNMGMNEEFFGSYLLDDGDGIQIGHWDFEAADHYKAWTPGSDTDPEEKPVNAVRVNLYQTSERGNGVATTLLRVAGFNNWNIHTTAIAALGYDRCYQQGFMSRKKVCQTSNSYWYPGFCLYGEEGLFLKANNVWGEGSGGVMPQDANADGIHQDNYDNGFDLSRDQLDIAMVDNVPNIAKSILSGDPLYRHPEFAGTNQVYNLGTTSILGSVDPSVEWLDLEPSVQLASLDGFASVAALLGLSGNHMNKPEKPGKPDSDPKNDPGTPTNGGNGCQGGSSGGSQVAPLPDDYDALSDVAQANRPTETESSSLLTKNRIYFHDSTAPITIDGTLTDVIIVSMGQFNVKNGSVLENVTLVSLDDRPNGSDAVSLNQTQLGRDDNCAPGGEALIYSMGSIGGPGKPAFSGATLVSGGSIGFAAQADSMFGIAAFAAGNISFTANNTFGAAEDKGVTANDSCAEGTYVPIPDEIWEPVLVH